MSAAHSRSPGLPRPGSLAGPVAGSLGSDAFDTAHRRFLGVVLALVALWSLALLLMDVGTVKPRTGQPKIVSPGQILKSHVVVVAKRVRTDGDRIKVERVIRGNIPPDEELRVLNLADVPNLSNDRSYLFALSRFRQDFEVTTLDGQRVEPLVYPASPDVIEQAKAILR